MPYSLSSNKNQEAHDYEVSNYLHTTINVITILY